MAEKKYLPPKNLVNPYVKSLDEYKHMYQQSIDDPKAFFGKEAIENLDDSSSFDTKMQDSEQKARSKKTIAKI